MLQSLRVRFALSHTLPILLLVPLLSLILLYLLQTRYFLDALSEELIVQARLIAGFARQDPSFWESPALAERYLSTIRTDMNARVIFFDRTGRVYAASTGSGFQQGDQVNLDLINEALQGATTWRTRYSANMQDNIVDVAVPINDAAGKLVGVVRLSQSMDAVQNRLQLLTAYIVIVFSFGILAALSLALFLGRALGIPLLRLTHAVAAFEHNQRATKVPETGPTELRQLASTFNHLAENLAEQNRLRNRMLASVVHEMSRPLGGINAAAQYLMRNSKVAPPELIQELSTDIADQVEQMTRQIDDLTTLSQAMNEQIELKLKPVSLPDLCLDELRHTREAMEAKSIALNVDIDPETPRVVADPQRVKQIVANLLNNAIKFTPRGGHIELAIYPVRDALERRAVEISIKDDGPGIDAADQSHIFQYFYRSPEQRPLQKGMGVGLAVASQLAEAHGGQLRVCSTPGAGAIFYLRLHEQPESEKTNG